MSIVSAGYYLRVVIYMYMHEPVSSARFNLSLGEAFTLAFMASIILILGVYPTVFLDISQILGTFLIQGAGR